MSYNQQMKKIILVLLFAVLGVASTSYAESEEKPSPLDFLLLTSNAEIVVYYDDGTIRGKIPLKKGIREGRAYSYYPNGSKKSEIYYVNGEVDGTSRGWYDNGKLKGKETIRNGVRHGYRKSYYKSGAKKEVVLYENGEPVEINMYHEDGSALYEKDYTKK